MIAITQLDKTIKIGKDFIGAVTDKPVWIVHAGGRRFEVCFECCGDAACEAVKSVFQTENKTVPTIFQFQRV